MAGSGGVASDAHSEPGSGGGAQAPAPTPRVSAAECGRTLAPQRTRSPIGPASSDSSGYDSRGFAALEARMRMEFNDLFTRHMQGVREVVAEEVAPLRKDIDEHSARLQAIESQLRERDDAISSLQAEVEQLRSAQDAESKELHARVNHVGLETKNASLANREVRSDLQRVQAEIALAATRPTPAPGGAGWSRAPDPTVAKLNCSVPLSKAAVQTAIEPLLRAASFEDAHVALRSPETVSTRWTIQFVGDGPVAKGAAARRCAQFLGSLRTSDGWRQLRASAADGTAHPIYISEDKNPQTIRREVLTKRLARMLERMDTTNKYVPVRAEGVVSSRYQKLVRILVPSQDEVQLEFNSVALQNYPISREDILAAWAAEMRGADAAGVAWQA